MERHPFEQVVKGPAQFRPEPWYNHWGDCVEYKLADEAHYARRVDDLLTVYHSLDNDRVIGFQIKGVGAMAKELDLKAFSLTAQESTRTFGGDEITKILLLAFRHEKMTNLTEQSAAYTAALGLAHTNIPSVLG